MSGPLPHAVYRRRRAGVTAAVACVAIGMAALAGGLGGDAPDPEPAGTEAQPPYAPGDAEADADAEAEGAEPPDGSHGATSTTWRSTGDFQTAGGESVVMGSGPVKTYTVEVEDGSGGDVDEFAAEVDEILADPRGWTGSEGIAFQRVSNGGQVDFAIRLAAPDTVDVLCAPLDTEGDVSCAQNGIAVINTMRWHRGADPSGLDLADYRRYLISHEVGHLLGHAHVECPGPGHPAPVMMQQTLDIGECAPNPWPHPSGGGATDVAGG